VDTATARSPHRARANLYPHPATPIPHFVVVRPATLRERGQRLAAWLARPWPAFDLVLWACVVAVAGMDIITTVVGLRLGLASEGNGVGAAAWHAQEAMGLLQLKVGALLAIVVAWALVPWKWRGYVRAGTMAGGTLTSAAVAHNAWLLLAIT
jgi:hypothetical protein